MKHRTRAAGVIGATLIATAASAQIGNPNIRTFQIPIPEIGTEFFFNNGGIPFSNEFDGGLVIDARLELVLEVLPTDPGDPRVSSGAHFLSEVIVPVDLDPSATGVQAAALTISGQDEGWDGTGTFTISRTLDDLIGSTWASPIFYTASTYNGISADEIVLGTVFPFEESFVTVTVDRSIPAPATTGALLLGAGLAARRRR